MMKENNMKELWKNAHKKAQINMDNPDDIVNIMQNSHSRIFTKVINEFILRIVIYAISLLTLFGLAFYGFGFLSISFSLTAILPFILGSLFLIFKLISEVTRLRFLQSQDDNIPIKDSTLNNMARLKKIKNVDFYINLGLCYCIAVFFILGYLLDIGGFKTFIISAELSSLIFTFIVFLIIAPWFIKLGINKRYNTISFSLKSSLNYFKASV